MQLEKTGGNCVRIESNPKILAGKPVIRGTRLSVEFIRGLLASGADALEILREYPGLELEDIEACKEFGSPLTFGRHQVELTDPDMIFRREDLYGDDGR